MKVASPYQCDVCKKLKTDDTQWFIGINTVTALVKLVRFTGLQPNHIVIVTPWDDAVELMNIQEREDIAHLCSTPCARDWAAQQVAQMADRIYKDKMEAEREPEVSPVPASLEEL